MARAGRTSWGWTFILLASAIVMLKMQFASTSAVSVFSISTSGSYVLEFTYMSLYYVYLCNNDLLNIIM